MHLHDRFLLKQLFHTMGEDLSCGISLIQIVRGLIIVSTCPLLNLVVQHLFGDLTQKKVSNLVWSSCNFWYWCHFVYTFYALNVLVNLIGWSSWRCHITIGSNVVPIHSLLNGALCPGSNSLDGAVTPLCYLITLWSVHTLVLYSYSPFNHEVLKVNISLIFRPENRIHKKQISVV